MLRDVAACFHTTENRLHGILRLSRPLIPPQAALMPCGTAGEKRFVSDGLLHSCSALLWHDEFETRLTADVYEHCFSQSPCESCPCKNGATCVDLYERNDYRCLCKKDYHKGKNCELRKAPQLHFLVM